MDIYLSEAMGSVFNGYELLLFKRFQSHPEEWKEWREKLKEREDKGATSFGVWITVM